MSHSILTIGHSTRTIDEFISLLRENGVGLLVDVRTIPKSRHNPQFGAEAIEDSLLNAGLSYMRMPSLGGLRHAKKDSINTGWRNESFRGFADYMQTVEFDSALNDLVSLAKDNCVTIMCAEAVPWRCHRSLIADALTALGTEVTHIMGAGKVSRHKLTSFAKIEGSRVWYPSIEQSLF